MDPTKGFDSTSGLLTLSFECDGEEEAEDVPLVPHHPQHILGSSVPPSRQVASHLPRIITTFSTGESIYLHHPLKTLVDLFIGCRLNRPQYKYNKMPYKHNRWRCKYLLCSLLCPLPSAIDSGALVLAYSFIIITLKYGI